MRFVCEYKGVETVIDVDKSDILIGRPARSGPPDVDLTPDLLVSRHHARIRIVEGKASIEDLDSMAGTCVNGREIKGFGRTPLVTGDTLSLGDSVLRIDLLDGATPSVPAPVPAKEESGRVVRVLSSSAEPKPSADLSFATRRLALLYRLPLELAAATRIDRLFETIVKQLVDAIPGAWSSALLVRDRASEQLLLKAHEPLGAPGVSLTLARRAMESREALSWSRASAPFDDVSVSVSALAVRAAMYAPMIWNDEPLGVICVANSHDATAFGDDDLELILAVARYAAVAMAHRQLIEDLDRNATLLSRLLTNFSPRVRDQLLAKARNGRLRLGGEKTEVSVLCSDIRGFTRISASMDAADIVDMLNDYFSVLVEALFAADGTIDKFVGDAILAVFGSPEPDPQHHEKAVRAAVKMQAAVKALNERRRARGLVTCDIGIGVHCGEVLHGFIGTADRMEFTVIGDTVNFASRYCDGAKATEVVISPALHQRVWRIVDAEPVTVPSKHEGDLSGYRVKGLK